MHVDPQTYSFFPSNFLLSVGSGVIAMVTTPIDPVITGIVLPFVFFALGKGVDVVVKIYLEKRKK